MKQFLYILIALLSVEAYCQNVSFDKEKSILYLCYAEKNDEVMEEIDDFSEYYPLVNAYYFEGKLNSNQKERILLEIYGNNQIIRDFPFNYSKIRLDSISNDTVVHFSIKNKNFALYPNETYKDSMITLMYQAILLKERIFDDINKVEKKIEFRLDAAISADTMPRFEYQDENLDTYLNNYGLIVSHEKNFDNAFLQIVLDERGYITYTRLIRWTENDDVNRRILKVFNEMPRWIPAMNGIEPVPIKMIIEIKKK